MKRLAFLLIFLAGTFAIQAQQQGFSIGPRLSSYSTDADIDILTVESGRQTAFGLVGDYRTGAFVLDFLYDHDPENGIDITDLLPIELGRYSRERAEATVGYAVLPILDLQAGFRIDQVSVGGHAIGASIFDELDFNNQALTAGVKLHSSQMRPIGVYALVRGYLGSADVKGGNDVTRRRTNTDTNGWRGEAGLMIPLGESNWHVEPGVEYERIQTQDRDISLETNRFFVNFVYRFPTR